MTTEKPMVNSTTRGVEDDCGEPNSLAVNAERLLIRGELWRNTAREVPEIEADPQMGQLTGPGYLIEKLDDKAAAMRKAAVDELGNIGSSAWFAIPKLLIAGCDPDVSVRDAVPKALDKILKGWPEIPEVIATVPQLIEKIEGRSIEVNRSASNLLYKIGLHAVPELSRLVQDELTDDIQRVFLIQVLGRIADRVDVAIPALAKALASVHSHVRLAAATALKQFGDAAEPATPDIVAALGDWHPEVRLAAARCLSVMNPDHRLAVPGLVQALADRHPEVREAAVNALVLIGVDAVPAIIEMLQFRDIEHLNERVKSELELSEYYSTIVQADYRSNPERALQNAKWCLRESINEHERIESAHEAALRVLGGIGIGAASAMPILQDALHDASSRVRRSAVKAIGKMESQAESSLPELTMMLGDRNPKVRRDARIALEAIDSGYATRDTVITCAVNLVENISNSNESEETKIEVFTALGAAAQPALCNLLVSGDRVHRELAAQSLGKIRTAPRDVICALELATSDRHAWVREAALEALRKLEPVVD